MNLFPRIPPLSTAGFLIAVGFCTTLAGQIPSVSLPGDTDRAILSGTTLDREGKPVADVEVGDAEGRLPRVHSDARGRFSLPLGGASFRYAHVMARTAGDALMGVWGCDDSEQRTVRLHEDIQVIMKPSLTVKVQVVDATDKAVSKARVVAMEANDLVMAGETDAMGQGLLRIPQDSRVSYFVAVKAGVGLDYFENAASRKWRDVKPLPAEVTLKLDGVATLKVNAVDSGGKGVAGVEFFPWYLKKPGRLTAVNVSSLSRPLQTGRVTDANGVATFDCLPGKLNEPVPLLCTDKAWYQPTDAVWSPQEASNEKSEPESLTTKLLRCAVARGVVLHGDGQPAAGILLQAEGRGNTSNYCRVTARTHQDGSFEFQLYPEQSYLIAVTDEGWAAPSISGLIMHEGTQRTDLFVPLGKGTLVSGTVFHKGTGKPLAKTTVTLIEHGAKIDKKALAGNRALSNGSEALVRWTSTDKDGRYTIRVGRGYYDCKCSSLPGRRAAADRHGRGTNRQGLPRGTARMRSQSASGLVARILSCG